MKKLFSVPEAIVLGILVLAVIITPLVSNDTFLLSLLGYTFAFSIFALSLYVILGWMGEISLGHALFYGLGIYVVGGLMMNNGIPFLLATLISMILMFALGALIGFITLRLTGVYFGIVTWGLAAVGVVAMTSLKDLTGGPIGMLGVPVATIGDLSLADPTTYAWVTGAALVIVIVVLGFIRQTPFGRRVNGSRINRNLVRSLGANSYFDRVLTFAFASALAALGGALSLSYIRIPTPKLLDVTTSVEAIVMVLLGGVAFIVGPVVGAVFFRLLPEQFHLAAEYREIGVAVAALAIILLAPKGIPEIVQRVASLFKKKDKPTGPPENTVAIPLNEVKK